MTTTNDLRPAGWYPDPSGQHQHRWWDGARWTEQVGDAGAAGVDPPPPPAPPVSPSPAPRRSHNGAFVAVAVVIAVIAAAVAAFALLGGGDDGPASDSGGGGGGRGEGLAGAYVVQGTNPNGSAYQGTAEITGDDPDYRISWVTGGTTSEGDGTLRGTTFEVVYTGALTGTGSATYELQDDGTLVGTWSSGGAEGTETLIPE